MNDTAEIERIVREVLAKMERQPESPAAPKCQGKAAPNSLVLRERLVTLETLRGRLDGVQQVQLQQKAVVTPAAQDALREARIRVSVGKCSCGNTCSKARLVLATAETNFEPAALIRSLRGQSTQIEQLASTGLASVVSELAETVARDGALGLLLTARTAAGACLANRNRAVRALVATDHDGTRRDCESLGANLLVIDPARQPFFATQRLVQTFVSGGARPCPPELRT